MSPYRADTPDATMPCPMVTHPAQVLQRHGRRVGWPTVIVMAVVGAVIVATVIIWWLDW